MISSQKMICLAVELNAFRSSKGRSYLKSAILIRGPSIRGLNFTRWPGHLCEVLRCARAHFRCLNVQAQLVRSEPRSGSGAAFLFSRVEINEAGLARDARLAGQLDEPSASGAGEKSFNGENMCAVEPSQIATNAREPKTQRSSPQRRRRQPQQIGAQTFWLLIAAKLLIRRQIEETHGRCVKREVVFTQNSDRLSEPLNESWIECFQQRKKLPAHAHSS